MQLTIPNPSVTKLEGQWLDAFRTGDYGDKGKYTEADLDAMVRNFDPTFHEPPAVIGHPKEDGPAYGWISAVRREGPRLQVQLRKVDPGFAEMVEAERFKKRSISLYKTPAGYSLRHIGFLGAQPPEIKGLADARFREETNNEVTEVTFEETTMAKEIPEDQVTLLTSLKQLLGIGTPVVTTGATFTEADIRRITAEAVTAATTPLLAEINTFRTSFAENATSARTAQVNQRVENAVQKLRVAGKWIPAFDKMGVRTLFTELAKIEGTVEFGEGVAKTTGTPLDLQVAFMEKLAPFAPFAPEVYAPANLTGAPSAAQFTESRAKASGNSVQLDQLTRKRMSDKSISYSEALGQVSKEHPELTAPGGSSAGEV